MNQKRLIQSILLLLSLAVLAGIAAMDFYARSTEKSVLSGFRLSSDDQCITVSWDEVSSRSVQSVALAITGEGFSASVSLNPSYSSQYRFTDGVHGERYTVSISLVYQDGTTSEAQEKSALFLSYDDLPSDVPLLQITTENYEDPEAEYVSASEAGTVGASIINNEPVEGTLVLTEDGKTISTGLEIKIRGNTSAYSEKKPYRLTLDQPIDLLNGESNCADTDWVLLAYSGTNLKTFLGNDIATLCGMEWQPQLRFVNVILNGDWKGCYLLTEAVERSSAKLYVEDTGYFFENDAYWWNSGGLYFKTENQVSSLGFTFQYPNITDASDARIATLQSYMQEVEDAILSGSASVSEYLDLDSWAGWLLCRDILGHGDAVGSNLYYYIYDLASSDASDRKIHMGPLWDFDGAFATVSGWSAQHDAGYLYFAYLFELPEFRAAYEELWSALYPQLLDTIEDALEALYAAQGAGLEESRALDSVRWQVERTSLKDETETVLDFFEEQLAWMEQQISEGLE